MNFDLEHVSEGEERIEWLGYDLLPLLENVPILEDLRICIQTLDDAKYPLPGTDGMDIMCELPLRTIHLDGMYIETGLHLAYDLDNYWASVTEAVMPSQYASLQELSFLAEIPKLRRLLVMLDLMTTVTPGPHSFRDPKPGPLKKLESSAGGKLAKDFEVMQHNAR